MDIQTSRHKGKPDDTYIRRNFEEFSKEPYIDRHGPPTKKGIKIDLSFIVRIGRMFVGELKKLKKGKKDEV